MRRRVAIFALATMVLVAAPGTSEAGAGVDRPADIPVHRYAADPATDLATLQARVDEAVRVVEEAEGQLRASVAEEQKVAGEIERLDDELTRIAVNEYMDGGAVRSSSLAKRSARAIPPTRLPARDVISSARSVACSFSSSVFCLT